MDYSKGRFIKGKFDPSLNAFSRDSILFRQCYYHRGLWLSDEGVSTYFTDAILATSLVQCKRRINHLQ